MVVCVCVCIYIFDVNIVMKFDKFSIEVLVSVILDCKQDKPRNPHSDQQTETHRPH